MTIKKGRGARKRERGKERKRKREERGKRKKGKERKGPPNGTVSEPDAKLQSTYVSVRAPQASIPRGVTAHTFQFVRHYVRRRLAFGGGPKHAPFSVCAAG